MTELEALAKQGELFSDTRFFLFLSGLVSDYTVARIKPSALSVLIVLRCYANHANGVASLSHSTIARYAGVSRHTVMSSLALLESEGLIQRIKTSNRHDSYKLVDKLSVWHGDEAVAKVDLPYKPRHTSNMLESIRGLLKDGTLTREAQASGVTLHVHLTINNNTTTINNAGTVNVTIGSNTAEHDSSLAKVMSLPPGPGKDLAIRMLTMPTELAEEIRKAKLPR
jgi:DNA-binding Lrp family transcriptional regulator